MDERKKAMIEKRLESEGLSAKEWREGDDGLEAVLGEFVVVSDNEADSLYQGDVGELTACVVGGVQYGNERVSFGFSDEGVEVNDLTDVEPAG